MHFLMAEVCKDITAKMEKLEQNNENIHFTTLMDQGVYIDLIVGTVILLLKLML